MSDVDSAELAAVLNELGMVGKYSGDFADAERAYRRALAIYEECGLGTSTQAASVLHNLGGLAHARRDFVEAESFARQGIAIREAAEGAAGRQLTEDRAALAAILVDLDKHDEARSILIDVVASLQRRSPPEPFEVAVALHNLGSLQFRLGEVGEAERTLRRALVLKEEALGPNHPDLAITLHNLACCLDELGRTEPAGQLFRRAIRILEPAVVPDHPTLVRLRAKIASI
jgi:tetratricopeptide (TPR) repeat protein